MPPDSSKITVHVQSKEVMLQEQIILQKKSHE